MSKFSNEIVEMYSNGNSVKEIMSKLGCSKGHIYKVLNENNVAFRRDYGPKNTRFTKELVEEMYKNYLDGKTLQQVGKLYGITKEYTSCLFRKYGFKCRNVSDTHRKYTIDEHFFDNIDTQEKAYFLGLLYADGTNNMKQRHIEVGLQERDKGVLEQISKIIGSNKPLYPIKSNYPGGQTIYKLEIVSKHMCDVLNEIGMVPNKSLVLEFPTNLNENLIRHFIRGYFDGDGYISRPEDGGCCVEIMSTLMFCEELKKYFNSHDIECYIRNTPLPETITRYLTISKKSECKKFCNLMYADSTISLERKYNKAFAKFGDCINNSLSA